MDKVLIVEDNPDLLKTLKMGLEKYRDKFETIAARDGAEAITALKKIDISLLVTDIQMPRIDGLSLLAFMKKKRPGIPCIVMSAHATAQIREKIQKNVLRFIEKPFQLDDLVKVIIPALNRDASGGSLEGISIANFMQMIEMEQQTCIFEVEAPEEGKGYFYFEEGVLFDATYGDMKGVEAALKLIPLEDAKIHFRNVSKGKKKIPRRIKEDLMNVIMEAMRLKDESEAEEDFNVEILPDELPESGDVNHKDESGAEEDFNVEILPDELPESGDVNHKDESEAEEDFDIQIIPDEFSELGDVNHAETEESFQEVFLTEEPEVSEKIGKVPESKETRDEFVINLKGHIEELQNINGYKAFAVMNFTGEILESDSKDPNIDLNYVCAMFNDIFLSAHKVCEKTGFDETLETTIVTPRGVVLMRCSGTQSKTHIHVIAILEPDGNHALMKMEMERMMPALLVELT
jgi:CheY-like chemotaxis protein/predicted regulator of Ras-like GTPase activity (Roadblock/LC7/MglB family)